MERVKLEEQGEFVLFKALTDRGWVLGYVEKWKWDRLELEKSGVVSC